MEKILKSKLVTCILILILASSILVFAQNVIVQEGNLCVEGDLEVDYGRIGYLSFPDTYVNYLYVDSYAYFTGEVRVEGYLWCYKLHALYTDPKWVQFDLQTRTEVVESVKREVPPEKQGGAVLFFNKDTKRLETYVPSEGKFYDLQGNLIDTMPTIEVATNYKTLYYFDRITGDVKAAQRAIYDRYVIKKGFRLNRETGHFINRASGDIVPREVAVEFQKGS